MKIKLIKHTLCFEAENKKDAKVVCDIIKELDKHEKGYYATYKKGVFKTLELPIHAVHADRPLPL